MYVTGHSVGCRYRASALWDYDESFTPMASGLYKPGPPTPIKHRRLVYKKRSSRLNPLFTSGGSLSGSHTLDLQASEACEAISCWGLSLLDQFPILAASDSHKRVLFAGCRKTEQAVARFSTFQQRQAQDSHTCPFWNLRPQIFGCVQFKSRRKTGMDGERCNGSDRRT